MPKLIFNPTHTEIEVNPDTKILVAARRNKIPIQFGCAACRCGTCAVKVSGSGKLLHMADDEKKLLESMKLETTSGNVRLACQARILSGEVEVDLDFQMQYSPDKGME